MNELKDALDDRASSLIPGADALARTLERARRRSRRRRVIAAVVALAIFASAAGILWNGFHGARPRPAASHAPAIAPTIAATGLTYLPSSPFGVAVGGGDVWVATYGEVLRVDASTMKIVATIPVPRLDDQNKIFAYGDSVWVTVGIQRLESIDVATNRIGLSIPLPKSASAYADVAVGDAGVFVMVTGGDVYRLDVGLSRFVLFAKFGGWVNGIVACHGAAWVTAGSGPSLVRIDPSGAITDVASAAGLKLGINEGTGPLSCGADSIWQAGSDSTLRWRFDGTVQRVNLGGVTLAATPEGPVWALTATGSFASNIYLPNPAEPATILALDPATESISSPVPVGLDPSYVGTGGDAVFVANFNEGALRRVELCPSSGCPVRTPSSARGSRIQAAQAQVTVDLLAIEALQARGFQLPSNSKASRVIQKELNRADRKLAADLAKLGKLEGWPGR